jgi:ribose transport system substrate-binding protein
MSERDAAMDPQMASARPRWHCGLRSVSPRRWVFWTLAIATAFGSTACSTSKPAYKYQIAVIPKGLTHEFWQSIHRGAEQAARDLQERQGITVDVKWDGPLKENDAQAQISIIDRNIAAGVSGIVLAPQHSEVMVPPVAKATKAGIPVLIIDSGLNTEGQALMLKYIATDNYNGGRLAAEKLIRILREDGKTAPNIILFRYQIGSESTDQREKGFEDYVEHIIEQQKKDGQPTITWLSRDRYAGATQDSAQREATPLLNNLREKGIDGIFAPNESSASGILLALRSLGLNKRVHLVGFDSSAPLVDALAEGNIDALVLQDPYRMGYLGVWTLVQRLEGNNVSPDGNKTLSTGEYVVTRQNLHDSKTRELFDPQLQKQRKIEVPGSQPK